MKAHATICIHTPVQVPSHYVHTMALELSLKGTIDIHEQQWLIRVEGRRTAINEFVRLMLHIAEFSEINMAINQTLQHFDTLTINIM
ncbi:MAG: hypothetical protein RR587_11610 [Solibacillus sp.]